MQAVAHLVGEDHRPLLDPAAARPAWYPLLDRAPAMQPNRCAEIALSRGTTEVGLRLWRRTVARLREGRPLHGPDPYMDPWALQILGTAVTAHAWAGRLEPVAELVGELRRRVRALLARPDAPSGPLSAYGTALHGLAVAGLAGGDPSAVRLLALAERLGVLREFQPTMSAPGPTRPPCTRTRRRTPTRCRWTPLGRDELREAARAVMAVTSGRG